MKPVIFFYTLSSLLLLARQSSAQDSTTAIIDRIEQNRALKDSLLRHGPESPIPAAERAAFKGLNYFPIDLKYRIAGELHAYGRPRQIQIPTTDGRSMPMERFGRFVASLEGKPFWLEVYRSLEEDLLEVFFKDTTNGEQTYGGGRYAHLSRLPDGLYLLDFNTSYNPYCAYNPDFICPLPPLQNHLSIAIPAGERNYGANLAH